MYLYRRLSTAIPQRGLTIDPRFNRKGFYYRVSESVKRQQDKFAKFKSERPDRLKSLKSRSAEAFKAYPKQQIERLREFADSKYEKMKDFKGKHVESIKTQGKKGINGIKELVSKYGATAVVVYLSLYFGTLGAIYTVFNTGLVDTATVIQWIQNSEQLASSSIGEFLMRNPNASVFGLSWIATKFTEPLRLVATVAMTPRIAGLMNRLKQNVAPPMSGGESESEEKQEK